MQTSTIKGLPLGQLKVVAVAEVLGFDPDIGEHGTVEVEMDVLPGCEELWAKFPSVPQSGIRCSICGHALKYACGVAHLASGQCYWVGRECAYKIQNLQGLLGLVSTTSVALAERIACDKRERDYLAAHPGAAPVIAGAKNSTLRIAQDMIEKLRRWGDLSDKQIQALAKSMADDKARRATATGIITAGRRSVRGTVLTIKSIPNKFAREYEPDTTEKLVVDLGDGCRVYGTKPQSLDVAKGDVISFTAAFEPSEKDNLFGFYSRPSKMTVVTKAPPAPALKLLEESKQHAAV